MTATIATCETMSALRARLDRLMTATNDLTDSAYRPLTRTLNLLGDIADQTLGLDITDWSQLNMHAMTALENMEAERIAGRPYEAWARELKGRLNALAGVIYQALGAHQLDEDDEPSVFDSGECGTCPCCSAEDCENGECLEDRAGAPKCPCTAVSSDTVLRAVDAKNGMLGYQLHALRVGAPLPGGWQIARVEDYGSDTHLLVWDGDGRKRYMHRHTEIRELKSGVVHLVKPEYAGWASD